MCVVKLTTSNAFYRHQLTQATLSSSRKKLLLEILQQLDLKAAEKQGISAKNH